MSHMFILGALLHFAVAALLVLALNWLNLLPFRRAATAHWTEKAQALWPARIAALVNIFLTPVLLHLTHELISPGTNARWLVNGLASALGALAAGYPFDRTIYPSLTFRGWMRLVVAGWSLRLGIWVVFIVAVVLMPARPSMKMVVVAGGCLAAHVAFQCGLAVVLLRGLKILRPAPERLQRIVGDAAKKMGAHVKAIWMFGGPQALAYALPTTGELLFGERLLEIADDEEIAGVAVHELGHLTESRAAIAGRIAGSLVFFPQIFIHPSVVAFEFFGILLPLAVTFLIARFAVWLSSRLEIRADTLATGLQSSDGTYARVLEKIYRENLLPAVNPKGRQTHPSLYDRMLAAGVTPDYPRPAPPRKHAAGALLLYVLLGVVIGLQVAFSPNGG